MRQFLVAVLVVITGACPAFSQDRETVVFLGPRGPFFIGVRLTVDDKDFQEWLTGYLFDKLDSKRDKQLTKDEIGLMPARLLTRLGFESGESLAASVLGDKKSIKKDDFVNDIRERLATSILISEKQQSAVQAINILPKFDADDDGHLSEKELQNALNHQAQRDIDDDEALSAAELLPFRDPAARLAAVAPNLDDLPFIQVVQGGEQKLAERLVRYYSQKDSSKLTPEGTRFTAQQFKTIDADSDGKWNAAETTAFLKDPMHHVELTIQFSRRRRPKLAYKVLTKDPSVVAKDEKKADRLSLVLDGLPIAIRCNQSLSSDVKFTRSFCGQRFSVSDKDRNKYLDMVEFGEFAGAVMGSVGALEFDALDANDDEMVTRAELFRHLDRDSIAAQSQLEVTVAADGRSMFQMLDTNLDRRLSMRELKTGFEKLIALDRDSDRRVSRIEASSPSQYTLQVGLGRPRLFQNGMNANQGMMGTNTVIRGTEMLEGPIWFRKMDRNRDGDVSRREFLGSSTQFDSLDTDKDELLSAAEAEAAKKGD